MQEAHLMLPAWLPAGLFPNVALPSPALSSAPPPQQPFQGSAPPASPSPLHAALCVSVNCFLAKCHLEGKSMNNSRALEKGPG